MNDKKGFCKLFDLNVPSFSDFDYYIDQLSKVPKWNNLKELIKLYEEAEEEIGDLYEYRMKKTEEIISFLKSTRAYEELLYDNLIPDLPIMNNFQYEEGKKYISIDLRQANWNSVKKYDPDFLNELGDTYEDFLDKFDVPEVFKYSKKLRQFIFGNVNPKRQIKAQRFMIQSVIDEIGDSLRLECVRHDEIIYSFDNLEDVISIYDTYNGSDKYNVKLYDIDRVENFKIETQYKIDGSILNQSMIGCNGNLFFINLKKYITKEELDIRDLYFRSDGKLAIWYDENLNISL